MVKVKYIADTGFDDGVGKGQIYQVIRENETQYIVPNDLGAISALKKEKFEIVEE